MPARRTNLATLDRAQRRRRKEGRLDDRTEPLEVLARTSAGLVDAVCAPDSDVVVYARVQAVRAYTELLIQLADRVPPAPKDPLSDPWERIAAALDPTSTATVSDHQEDEAEAWDRVEDVLGENPTTWPNAS